MKLRVAVVHDDAEKLRRIQAMAAEWNALDVTFLEPRQEWLEKAGPLRELAQARVIVTDNVMLKRTLGRELLERHTEAAGALWTGGDADCPEALQDRMVRAPHGGFGLDASDVIEALHRINELAAESDDRTWTASQLVQEISPPWSIAAIHVSRLLGAVTTLGFCLPVKGRYLDISGEQRKGVEADWEAGMRATAALVQLCRRTGTSSEYNLMASLEALCPDWDAVWALVGGLSSQSTQDWEGLLATRLGEELPRDAPLDVARLTGLWWRVASTLREEASQLLERFPHSWPARVSEGQDVRVME